MTTRITFERLNEALLTEFPGLFGQLPERVGPDLNPGAYVVFGSVFNDHVIHAADDPKESRHVADFIERMATEGDGRTEDLLKIEIVPTLLASQRILNCYWQSLGPRTRHLLQIWAPSVAPGIDIPQ